MQNKPWAQVEECENPAARDEAGGTTRREFLAGLGAGAAATLAMMSSLPGCWIAPVQAPAVPAPGKGAAAPSAYLASEEPFFAQFKKTLLLRNQDKYIVNGQKGSMPIPILKHFKEGLDQIAEVPFPVYLEPPAETRAKIAKGYGARVDEIAISRNTTDAISQIMNGQHWEAGDEILCSTMEYHNCIAIVLRMASHFNVRIRQFGVPMGLGATAEEVVESVRRQIRPGKTKLIFFSCPTNPNGQKLPARRIAKLAQEYGIITAVDGAHYGGMFVPELDEMGIDFWGIAGHKWQCGPGGTGILYVRNAELSANLLPLPRFHLVRSGDLDGPMDGSRPSGWDIGAALSVYGFPESADWRALGEACQLWDALGRKRIESYILELSDYTRSGIAAAFGEEALLQPIRDPEMKSGIVAFNPFPEKSQKQDPRLARAFQDRMFSEYGYHVGMGGYGPTGLTRPPDPEAAAFTQFCIPNRDPVTNEPAPTVIPFRVDTAIWNTRQNFDDFIAICRELTAKLVA
ncbi:MAG: aminotransferase class V-fold PLP-dependent enzyme [Thermodesulfobacteriota bacterium]